MDFEDFEAKAKDEKVKGVSCCAARHNPLGIVWKPEELKKMAEICIANDVLLVSDEIHSDLIFHGKEAHAYGEDLTGDRLEDRHLRIGHQDLQPGPACRHPPPSSPTWR